MAESPKRVTLYRCPCGSLAQAEGQSCLNFSMGCHNDIPRGDRFYDEPVEYVRVDPAPRHPSAEMDCVIGALADYEASARYPDTTGRAIAVLDALHGRPELKRRCSNPECKDGIDQHVNAPCLECTS